MVYINLKYSTVYLLSAVSVVLATFAEIELQLGFVSSNSTNWDNLLNAFPTTGGSLTEAIDILIAGQNFADSLSTVAELTAANGPLNVANATEILNTVLMCMETLQNSLFVIAAKEPALVGLPSGIMVQGFTHDILELLNASSIEFANSFIGVAPASLLPIDTAIRTDVSEAFATAIDAFN
ncbi:hypothetical protein HYPSUDRAFT_618359 [Hypholoma sublateritium FD-334 SS-4]|uniref:Uncharacterized protein n=1 Tax=Hypholoma sublateritium (strain FD-334 SS-4) TaxID=945553 RepID=A0A0D2QAU9_HYPSF|nr:hypothetical protein HYPSUDRAFT_618359 [Hypholoma sublateritium FD-334 SS-4]